MTEQQAIPEWARDARLVAVLTGAGVSTDSGIPDYRGPQGLWKLDPEAEKTVTYSYYMDDPAIRRRAWQARRDHAAHLVEPNAAHRALVELEQAGVPLRVLTQNVDGLHQRAGLPDRKVIELHGTARRVVCTGCGLRSEMAETLKRVADGEEDPHCVSCEGVLKSATVMFGQRLDPPTLAAAISVAKAADLFLAVGSSLRVEPAASLCRVAVEHGALLVVVNDEETPYDELATAVVREPIGTALPEITRAIAAARREAG